MTNIVGAEPADLHIGMALVVDFQALDERVSAPVFRPA